MICSVEQVSCVCFVQTHFEDVIHGLRCSSQPLSLESRENGHRRTITAELCPVLSPNFVPPCRSALFRFWKISVCWGLISAFVVSVCWSVTELRIIIYGSRVMYKERRTCWGWEQEVRTYKETVRKSPCRDRRFRLASAEAVVAGMA